MELDGDGIVEFMRLWVTITSEYFRNPGMWVNFRNFTILGWVINTIAYIRIIEHVLIILYNIWIVSNFSASNWQFRVTW